VSDQAGNTSRCDAPQPVVLDSSKPKATVFGVSPNNPAAYPPRAD
jgi:hypothetical protein